MNLYEGIFERRSVRSYLMEPLEPKLLENIMNFAGRLEMISPGQQVRFEIVSNLEKRPKGRHVPGSGSAPYYLMIHAKREEDYLLNAGFLAEQIVLYMTTKRLGTCYLGMMRLPEAEGLEPIIAVAFGRPAKGSYEAGRKPNRKPLEKLYYSKAPLGGDMTEILQAARLAPSAMNGQPWRFVVSEGRIHLFCRKDRMASKEMRRLHGIDMGIALAHLALAAEELWYSPTLKKVPNISEQTFKRNEYVITLRLGGERQEEEAAAYREGEREDVAAAQLDADAREGEGADERELRDEAADL